jgi:hypothetical protein
MSLKGFNVDWVLTLDTNVAAHTRGGGDPANRCTAILRGGFSEPHP